MCRSDAARNIGIALLAFVPQVVAAQATLPPLRRLHPAAVASNAQLRSIAAVRALPGGKVIVNDVVGGRLVVLDSMLRIEHTVATAARSQSGYRPARGGLIPYLADSTLFLDVARLSLLVIDPAGRVARTVAAPRSSELGSLTSAPVGNPGVDRRGRLVYRLGGPPRREQLRRTHATSGQPPDSAPIVRFHLKTRRIDTAAFVRVHSPRVISVRDSLNDGVWFSPVLNPMPVVDEWAVLADGTLAILRGEDYRVDYVDATDRTVSGKRLPFERTRMTRADKIAALASSKALRARLVAEGVGISVNAAPLEASGLPDDDTIIITEDGATTARGARQSPPVLYASADELPEFHPVFASGGVRPDGEGRLWIRTIAPQPLPADATYHVVSRGGSLVDRVQIPRTAVLVGFGPGGVIYLRSRNAVGALTLTRIRDR